MSLVKIADMVLDISCADETFFSSRLQDYLYHGNQQPNMTIHSRVEEDIVIRDGGITQNIRENLRLVTYPNGTFCRYVFLPKSGRIVQAIDYDEDYRTVNIRLLASRRNRFLSLTGFEYGLTGAAFGDRLVRLGGVVMHGSALSYRGDGIVFTANSGTGKSTQARLWRERFGNDIIMINDDKPALRMIDDVPFLFGTPWSGKTDLNTNVSAPLKAILVLEQAPHNAMRKLSASEAVYHLANQATRPYYDQENGIRTFDFVTKLAETVPCYHLQCTVDPKAVTLVHNTLFPEEVTQ